MSKTIINLILDLTAGLLFLAMILTGFIIRFPLPPGTNKTRMLWGLARHEYGVIHYWFSIGLLVVLFLHLILHWQWLTSVIGRRILGITTNHKSTVRAGLVTVFTIIALFTAFAFAAYRSVTDASGKVVCNAALPSNSSTGITPVAEVIAHTKIDFRKDVYPIIELNCIICHGPRKQLGGFRADIRDNYFGKSGMEAFIIPGNSNKSILIEIVSGKRPDMKSAEAHLLPKENILTLEKWIDEGADWPHE
ncbi:MAG: DUF4405 domain-containing protein [Chitinophagaceae bacterium]|nr:DUF4405 domain-containing protein [Chitinophagaceae bacterium]